MDVIHVFEYVQIGCDCVCFATEYYCYGFFYGVEVFVVYVLPL